MNEWFSFSTKAHIYTKTYLDEELGRKIEQNYDRQVPMRSPSLKDRTFHRLGLLLIDLGYRLQRSTTIPELSQESVWFRKENPC